MRPQLQVCDATCCRTRLTRAQAFLLPGLPVCASLLLLLSSVPVWTQQLCQQAYSLRFTLVALSKVCEPHNLSNLDNADAQVVCVLPVSAELPLEFMQVRQSHTHASCTKYRAAFT